MSTTQSQSNAHVLYHFDFSICSIMVRYGIALCGESRDEAPNITIHEEKVDILHREHMTEEFLCKINPPGEVPVLVTPNGKPIPDSREITKYLASFYPSLIPPSHRQQIEELLAKLHGISFFSITFAGRPEGSESNKQYLQGLLSSDQTSDEYKMAITHKIEIIDEHLDLLKHDQSQENEAYAKNLMQEFDELLKSSQTRWLLGLEQPSALDAHLVTFIARMLDRKRGDLIPERLQSYGKKLIKDKAWNDVMQGKSTLPLKI